MSAIPEKKWSATNRLKGSAPIGTPQMSHFREHAFPTPVFFNCLLAKVFSLETVWHRTNVRLRWAFAHGRRIESGQPSYLYCSELLANAHAAKVQDGRTSKEMEVRCAGALNGTVPCQT